MAVNYNDYMGFGASADDSGVRHTINHLPAVVAWEPDVYQMENGDYMIGGRNGVMNLQAQQLTNRTEYLKKVEEDLKAQLDATQPGTEKYDELVKRIEALDANKQNNRINHLERLMANAYLALEMSKIDPDGYDNMLIETFDGSAEEIDQITVNVTSVVSGDDSIDVESSSGLIIGAHYQLTDGERTEEVQIKSIAVSGKINRVKLESVVKNQYNEGRATLYRSSTAIYNGRAYGGGNVRTDKLTDCASAFRGSNTKVELTKSIDYSDPSSFTLKGAHLKDGVLVMGGDAYGVAFNAAGSTYGDWKRVNSEGDNLAQDDLSEEG